MSTAARVRQEPRRLELVAREIAGLPGVETHAYRAGEVLLPTERLKQLDVYVRDGAIGLRLAVGRANHAMLDVFGPGSLVTPHVWDTESRNETRHAVALLPMAEQICATGESPASARLEVSQDLIAAFANLSRQTTNRQLRRLARAGLAGLERRLVDLRDLAALRGVAA